MNLKSHRQFLIRTVIVSGVIVLTVLGGCAPTVTHLVPSPRRAENQSLVYLQGSKSLYSPKTESNITASATKIDDRFWVWLYVANNSDKNVDVMPASVSVRATVRPWESTEPPKTYLLKNVDPDAYLKELRDKQRAAQFFHALSIGLQAGVIASGSSTTHRVRTSRGGAVTTSVVRTRTYNPGAAAAVLTLGSIQQAQMAGAFNRQRRSVAQSLLRPHTMFPGTAISGYVISDALNSHQYAHDAITVDVNIGGQLHRLDFLWPKIDHAWTKKTLQCVDSQACRARGLCAFDGQSCVPGDHVDCRRSTACGEQGRCNKSGSQCVATQNEDCARTSMCKSSGLCTAKQGQCVVATNADCANCMECKKHGRCVAKDGKCVGALMPLPATKPAPKALPKK